ncbi:MAG: hypothetical protein A2275_13095 [Bacteroidetes bacterium RIFOXYA12_FULL_35_11]|nr:MAG: hypothetical protein A2X01_19490 [Bacteroidetes bacterium GWF2_35_48]OFY74830.1 MAG: hypothetical protein A2275_13095 [Bacteroidetes bacterium RIFOXYA12_FULL_35_11]
MLIAQQWTIKTTTFPSCYTQSNGFCVINNKAYIGLANYYCQDWWEFDPINNTTTQKASFPITDSTNTNPTCFSINGNGYIMSSTGRFYKYDPIADTWTQKAAFPINFPNGDSIHSTTNCSFVINGKGYLAGYTVCSNDYSSYRDNYDLYEYDPIIDNWQNKGPILDSAWGFTGFTINNLGYIIGGNKFYNTPPLAGCTVYEYNPQNNSWTKKTSCPMWKILSRGFVIGTKFYYGSGIHYDPNGSVFTMSNMHNQFYSYDQPSDSWQQLDTLPDRSMWDEGVGFAINGKGYLGLGDCWGMGVPPVMCGPGFYLGIWEFDPTISSISEDLINSAISISQNQSNGVFMIQSPTLISKIEITNIHGRIIYSSEINYFESNIDLKKEAKGVYLVKIYQGEKIKIEKIMVQ